MLYYRQTSAIKQNRSSVAPQNRDNLADLKGDIILPYIGLAFGMYVLLTIGIYHVLIVKLEQWFGAWPWLAFLIIGLVCIYCTLTSPTETRSMWWGYNAFINLWSVKEMFDQHRRS